MTQYPVSPEDQPMQSRDMFVPEHAPDTSTTPTPSTEAETAPSVAQTTEPETEATPPHPHVPASRMMGQIVSDSE